MLVTYRRAWRTATVISWSIWLSRWWTRRASLPKEIILQLPLLDRTPQLRHTLKKADKEKVNKEFKVVPGKVGTRTDLVLRVALNRLFTPEGGDRPDAQNLMLIFTDGKPWIGKWDDRKMVPFWETTKALEVT